MLKRATLYLRRKYRRTILLLVLLFVISFSLAIGLTVWNSIGAVTRGIRQELGTSFVMRVPSYVKNDPAQYEDVKDKDGNTQKYYVGPRLNDDIIAQIVSQVDEISAYNADMWHIVWMEDTTLIPGAFSDTERGTWSDPLVDESQYMAKFKTDIYGNTETALYSEFRTGSFELAQGRHIVEGDRNEVLVSEQFAERNGLAVGDSITVTTRGLRDVREIWGGPLALEIVGIFRVNGYQPTGSRVYEADMAYNWLLADAETVKDLHEASDAMLYTGRSPEAQYDNVTFFVDDPAQLDTVMDELETLDGLNILDYEVAVDDTMYRTTVDPLLSIRNLVAVVVAAAAAGCFVVLCIVFTMWVRSRRREVAIYLSLGFRKGKIIGQFVLEAAAVALAALILTAAVCGPVAGRIGNGLLSSAVEAAQPEEQQFSEDELWQAALAGETLYHYDSGSYAGPEQIDFTFGLVEVLLLAALELLIITAAVCKGGSFIFTMQPRQIMTTLS